MAKRRYNSEARKVVKTVIDNSEVKKIKLDFVENDASQYDESNALVLPSQKRKTKLKVDKSGPKVKLLSKKHRKRLEKVVERKKKKENRASLLDALAKVQATPEELSQLTSISTVQTKGLRRQLQPVVAALEAEGKITKKVTRREAILLSGELMPNSIKGAKSSYLTSLRKDCISSKYDKNDPNVVGLESSSDDGEDDDGDDDEENVKTEQHSEIEEKSEDVMKQEVESEEIIPEVQVTVEANIKSVSDAGTATKVKKSIVQRAAKPAVYVDVNRKEDVEIARLKLPILAEEQVIMETINANDVTIIAGETGSGKTTQVPQFLYEAGYAISKQIAVTEPRRVAAIAMSKRVEEELNLGDGKVAYLIRFEGNVTEETKIKFMTDGVLYKEVQKDFLLNSYSVVILDEAHERSWHTDVLIGLLSRIVTMRRKKGNPLKLIIMSATLRISDFTENQRLFRVAPPVVKVDARQFKVVTHFAKTTAKDYMGECFKKVTKIHNQRPDGGILVFVTGQEEVKTLVRKLRKAFPLKNKAAFVGRSSTGPDIPSEGKKGKRKKVVMVPKIDLDDYPLPGIEEGGDHSDLSDLDTDFDDNSDDEDGSKMEDRSKPLYVLPLYSNLPNEEQAKIFKTVPQEYQRICVVSTNVAETSLTIPGIKYVVDTGKTKTQVYDKVTGVSTYIVTWTSKASAEQRAGRAGRTGPGECYRLYSSAVYNDVFPEFAEPQMVKKPIDDLYLEMKGLLKSTLTKVKVENIPLPSPPTQVQYSSAKHRLMVLGALDPTNDQLTKLGKEISKYPVLPRFGKMLALARAQNPELLPYVITLVAALSIQEVLLERPIGSSATTETEKETCNKWAAIRRKWTSKGNYRLLGDAMVLIFGVGCSENAFSNGLLEEHCQKNGLRLKALSEIRKIRLQLFKELGVVMDPNLKMPSDEQAKQLRQLLLAGMGDHVARKVEGSDKGGRKAQYETNGIMQPAHLHYSSVFCNRGSKRTFEAPEFVVYQEIFEVANKLQTEEEGKKPEGRLFLRGITAIEPQWLPTYVPYSCHLREIPKDREPVYNKEDGKVYCSAMYTFGSQGQAWELPAVNIEYPEGDDKYKSFAKFVLEGEVFPKLKRFRGNLLSTPSIMLKSWAKLQKHAVAITGALRGRGVGSRQQLMDMWKSGEEKFLLEEYLMWTPEALQSKVREAWPPL